MSVFFACCSQCFATHGVRINFSLLKACSLIKKTQQGTCACETMIDVISCDTVRGEFLCPLYCTSASKSRSLLKSLESLQSSSSVSLASKSGHSAVKTASLDFNQLWFSPCLWICFRISYRKRLKHIFFKWTKYINNRYSWHQLKD